MSRESTGDRRHGAAPGRILAFDGLRGVAAAIVVVFHYLCMVHWQYVPGLSVDAPAISHSPLGILWAGHFSVTVFFVLSGFVMATASDRRRDALIANVVVRYQRLAVPVVASCLLAWLLLSLAPSAAMQLADASSSPSVWLTYTHQGAIPGLGVAIADGLLLNFYRGGSKFNNPLWTMQIELIGSIILFVLYWLSAGRMRIILLYTAIPIIFVFFNVYYLSFIIGALFYEYNKAGRVGQAPQWTGLAALVAGVCLGALGEGFWPALLGIETVRSEDPAWISRTLAATLLLYAAFHYRPFRTMLERSVCQFLGRISFSLYLIHVPFLYTLVAGLHLNGALPEWLIVVIYLVVVTLVAILFTRLVDEPNLAYTKTVRAKVPVAMAMMSRGAASAGRLSNAWGLAELARELSAKIRANAQAAVSLLSGAGAALVRWVRDWELPERIPLGKSLAWSARAKGARAFVGRAPAEPAPNTRAPTASGASTPSEPRSESVGEG